MKGDEEYQQFIEIMEKKLSRNFNKGNITKKDIKLYWDHLKKWDIRAVERGCDYLIDHRVYHDFPNVGEITQAIKNSKNLFKI